MLSHRYIPSRQLPDKAISLLDTACARVAISLHAPPAQIQTLTQQLSSLKEEAEMLRHEASLGKDRAVSLARVTAEMDTLTETLSQRHAHWLQEQTLCQDILALQTQLSEVQPEDSQATTALRAQRMALEHSLSQLQGDRAQVHLQVDEAIVAAIVADWTGIPVGRMATDDVLAVLGLQDQLQQRVIGQSTAIAQISERLKTSKAKLTDPQKPLGVFMLVGTSGVGKTETALALAEAMYGGEHNLITINMSEYQEAHTVSSLKGSPPGYVGYGEGGVLTEAVRRRPYSVILLDEVEKAHSDVHEIFYQVFDKGCMEDGEGRVIDFKNTLILLTSNAGSDLIDQLCEDPALMPNTEALAKALQPELRKTFPAAFLGRLNIVPYFPLGLEVLQSIVQLQLNKVVKRMATEHGIALHYTPAVMTHIVTQCGTHETGARRLGQFIEQNLLPMLAHLWLQAMQDKYSLRHITVDTQAAPVNHPEVPTSLQLAPQAGLHLHVVLENT
jgi:type VI secretion system protein VasG